MSRQGKYGVAPAAERTSRDGVVFDSKGELARWEELRLLERAGEVSELRRQVRYDLAVEGVKVGTYVADFSYLDHKGRHVVEDFKGVRTPVYRLKKKLMLAIYGIHIHETDAPPRRPRTRRRKESR